MVQAQQHQRLDRQQETELALHVTSDLLMWRDSAKLRHLAYGLPAEFQPMETATLLGILESFPRMFIISFASWPGEPEEHEVELDPLWKLEAADRTPSGDLPAAHAVFTSRLTWSCAPLQQLMRDQPEQVAETLEHLLTEVRSLSLEAHQHAQHHRQRLADSFEREQRFREEQGRYYRHVQRLRTERSQLQQQLAAQQQQLAEQQQELEDLREQHARLQRQLHRSRRPY